MKKMKIFLATDHAGFELKEEIKKYLKKLNYEVCDEGAYSFNPNDDYVDFIAKAAKKVAQNPNSKGIIFGGSGQGEAIVANKFKGIRAAVYYGANPEIVKLFKTHNNANILSIGSRLTTKDSAIKAVKVWLDTDFNKDPRHFRRIKKIENLEKKLYK